MLVDLETKEDQSILLPSAYYSDTLFLKEKEFLFDKTWQLAGFYRDLKSPNDYITVDYFGKSVVIRNFDGELKAFLNVCSHRFSRICQNKKGNGFLQCPYHGWTYDKNGYPYAIPGKNAFSELNMETLKLSPFNIELCGEFVFIRKRTSGHTLKDFLGSYYQLLISISDSLDELVDENHLDVNANWKIVVENTLEEYHVGKVHPNSIAKMGLTDQQYYFNGQNSCATMHVKNQLDSNARLSTLFDERSFKIDGYHHYLMFPNMTLATTFGTTFSIQKITPIDSRKTHFVSYVFGTKLKNKKNFLKTAYENSVKELNQRIFYEDKLICEEVQIGIEMTDRKISPFSRKEQRIYAFQKACNEYVNYEE